MNANITADTSERLNAALVRVLAEVTRTDTKASVVLALNGVLLAAVTATAPRLSGPAALLAVGAAAAMLVSAVLAVLVMRPRISVGSARNSFPAFAALPHGSAVLAALTEDTRAADLHHMSGIVVAKMRWLRHAATVSVAAVALTAAAGAAAALG